MMRFMEKTSKKDLATRLGDVYGGTLEGKMSWTAYFMGKNKAELVRLVATLNLVNTLTGRN